MNTTRSIGWAACCATLFAATAVRADDLFLDQVAAVLERRCVSCHNAKEPKGDLALDTGAAAKAAR